VLAYVRSSNPSCLPTIPHLYSILTFAINLQECRIRSCNLTLVDSIAIVNKTSQSVSISSSFVSFVNCSFYNTPPSSPFAKVVLKSVIQLNAIDSTNTTNFHNALIDKLDHAVSSENNLLNNHQVNQLIN
jgi:hypothetical protein